MGEERAIGVEQKEELKVRSQDQDDGFTGEEQQRGLEKGGSTWTRRGKETRGREVMAWREGLVKSAGEFYSREECTSPRRACVAVKPGSC